MLEQTNVKLDDNKSTIDLLKEEIKNLEVDIVSKKKEVLTCQQRITCMQNEIAQLMSKLTSRININYAPIQQEMINFYNGWITQMGVLGCKQQEMSTANAQYQNIMNSLIPNS